MIEQLNALIDGAYASLRSEHLEPEYEPMIPKLQGVLQSFNLLQHNLEADADDLAKRIQAADQRRVALKQNSHNALGQVGTAMGEIEDFLGAMEGSNGAPLDSSSASSTASAPVSSSSTEPQIPGTILK